VAFATTRDTVEHAREVHDQGYFEANRDFIYPDGSPNYFEYAMPRTLFFWALGFSQFAPKDQRALDVGCGNGLMLRYLRFLGYEPWGVEISEWAAEYARTVVGEERVTTGTLHEVGYPDGHFRLVTLVHVLEHLDEPAPLLAEVRRVLEPGGLLYVEVPSSERDVTDYLIGDHFWFYCVDALRYLLTCAGFRDVRVGEGWGKPELHSVPFIFALAHAPG
jgi:2-polyprenyl-3-methyl-5-hydroxy-6-metoxy-1,4-benzoquinol methylase